VRPSPSLSIVSVMMLQVTESGLPCDPSLNCIGDNASVEAEQFTVRSPSLSVKCIGDDASVEAEQFTVRSPSLSVKCIGDDASVEAERFPVRSPSSLSNAWATMRQLRQSGFPYALLPLCKQRG
jgi:hypothetical protein